VQACFRGQRLYDSEETKAVVKKWVSFYKQHRDVLDNGEIIHLRRPSGRDWDGILHANPLGKEQGMLCIYNPLNEEITRSIRVPMHYTGLRHNCHISIDSDEPKTRAIDGSQHITLLLKIPAQGRRFVILQK
jgi:alpha-galactosidase